VVEGGQYAEKLRHLFEQIHGKPQWADIEGREPHNEAEDALLQRSGKIIASSSSQLPAGILDLTPLRPANRTAMHSVRLYRGLPCILMCYVVSRHLGRVPSLVARNAHGQS
jgi:hypothetical protein